MKRILGCLFGLLWAIPSHAELPAGYTQLEYIESTGTQYIDTGIKTNQDTEIQSKWSSDLNSSWVYGDGSSNPRMTLYASTEGNQRFGNVFVTINAFVSSGAIHTTTQNKTGLLFDGEMHQYTNVGTFTVANTLTIFHNIYSPVQPGLSGNMYFLQVYNGETLVRDFIPAKRNSDGEVGMYDTVTNTFFTNAGTGSFIAGPVAEIKIATTKYVDDEFAPLDTALANAISVVDSVVTQTIAQAAAIGEIQNTKQTRPDDDDECPAGKKCLLVTDETGTPHWYEIIEGRLPDGYTELEYIESTGTQWIDTGYSVDYTTATHLTIKSDMLITSTSGYRLCGLGGANSQFYFGIQASSKFAYGDGETDKSTGTAQLNKWYSYEYSTKNGTFTVKDASDTVVANVSFGFSSNYGADRNIYLFAYNEAHSAKAKWTGKIKGYTIYYDNTIVLNLTPAKRNSDSAIGMYDIVSGTFFENAGTGSFIGGAPVFN